MKDAKAADLFDPRTIMDSDHALNRGLSSSSSSSSEADFAFAFNDSNFSDRLLRIEIMAGSPDSKSDADGCTTLADWARNRKRRREDIKKENGLSLSSILNLLDKLGEKMEYRSLFVSVVGPEEQILNIDQPDADDVGGFENQDDEEAVAMVEESPSGANNCNSIVFLVLIEMS
ncbi:hypothetical protein RJ641_016701 [Dillenia turbinata]|uniref:Uncharacterized protein n=1 Tax=Dillenia turbinata TaxID=194707 RepID=A0AAN8UPX5_9MAGN